MKKLLWFVLGLLVVVLVVPFVIGSSMPRDHVATMSIPLKTPPDRVWAVVSDFAGAAAWRKELKSVRAEPPSGGAVRFTESSSFGDVTFEVVTQDPPMRQVVRIVDEDQPFGGAWTWELVPNGSGTRLTITEAGFVKNPMFRFMGALFRSPTDTLRDYLKALAAHLGESAEPVVMSLR